MQIHKAQAGVNVIADASSANDFDEDSSSSSSTSSYQSPEIDSEELAMLEDNFERKSSNVAGNYQIL